ncbi:MAG: TetR family transcriptional regulator [Herbinix sp.]|jgi:AcrR family transcriptional regulator|nr:TetR family transcriptional regulator [Herbinix sp.]
MEVKIIGYDSFENIDEEKRQTIINAGFKVFGKNGYKKASVDEIIQEAKISKGSLFYYFGSKKNFYLYLYEFSGEQMKLLVDHPGEDNQPTYLKYTDFFERVNAIQLIKMKHSSEFPNMYSFMKRAVFDDEPEIKEGMAKINQRFTSERILLFFKGIDFYKFKDGIDPKMVIQLISWCSEGCANQIQLRDRNNPASSQAQPDFQEIFQLFQSYLELFRSNFYKEEYLNP